MGILIKLFWCGVFTGALFTVLIMCAVFLIILHIADKGD